MNFKSMGGGDGEAPPMTLLVNQSTVRGPEQDFWSMVMARRQMIRERMQALLMGPAIGDDDRGVGFASGSGVSLRAGSGITSALQRQGSLTLPRTISQKTVVEAGGGVDVLRQPTLVEMTPEEGLERAGVVWEDVAPLQAPQRPIDSQSNNSNVFFSDFPAGNDSSGLAPGFIVSAPTPQISVANLEMTDTEVRPYVPPMPLGNQQAMTNSILVGFGHAGWNDGLVPEMVGMGTTGDLSSVSPVTYVPSSGVIGRKSSGTVEKVTERRLRRMIKSRESAARSRARKQAHTMELEAEVAKLGEQNQELLKKLAEMMEMKKNQISVGRRIIGRFKSYWRWAYRGQFE